MNVIRLILSGPTPRLKLRRPPPLACRRMLDASSVDEVRELSWRQNLAGLELPQRQEVLVTSHDAFGAACMCEPEDVQVLGIAASLRPNARRLVECAVHVKVVDDGLNGARRQFDLLAQILVDLVKQFSAHEQVVCVEADLEYDFAQTMRSEGRDDYIGVKQNSHEIALNTSSSVRKPCASAKGRAFWRRARNCSTAT